MFCDKCADDFLGKAVARTVGERYIKAKLSDCIPAKDLQNFQDGLKKSMTTGNNIFITGQRNTGKTRMAAAIQEGRPCRLSAQLALHVTEVTEALQHPDRFDRPHEVSSSFDPIAPQPWAI